MLGQAQEVQAGDIPAELEIAVRRPLALSEAGVSVGLAPEDPRVRRRFHSHWIARPPNGPVLGSHFEAVHARRIECDPVQFLQRRNAGRNLPLHAAIEQHIVGRSAPGSQVPESILRSHR